MKPVMRARGIQPPSSTVPYLLMKAFGAVGEVLMTLSLSFSLLRWLISIPPLDGLLLTRIEVDIIAVPHFYSTNKARSLLNYSPTINSKEGSERMGRSLKMEEGGTPPMFFRFPSFVWFVLISVGMGIISTITYLPHSPLSSSLSPLITPFISGDLIPIKSRLH